MGRVISDGFVQNAWRLGETWRNRRKEKKIGNAMATYMDDPEDAIRKVFDVDPEYGMAVKKNYEAEKTAELTAADTARKTKMERLKTIAGYLTDASEDPNKDFLAEYDKLTPVLKTDLGLADDEVTHYRGALAQNPALLRALTRSAADDKIYNAGEGDILYDSRGNVVGRGGARRPQTRTIHHADGSNEVIEIPGDSSAPAGAPTGGGPAPMSDAEVPEVIARSVQSKTISRIDAMRMEMALGAGGKQEFRSWLKKHGVVVGDGSEDEPTAYLPTTTIQPAPGDGVRSLYKTPPKAPEPEKPKFRVATTEEKTAAGVDPALPYQISPEGEMKPIGPTASAKKSLPQDQQARYNNITDKLGRLEQAAAELRDHKGLPRMTGLMAVAPSLPGSAAKNAEAKMATLKSQIAFTILQDMRDMSKTGGALGNVSNYEIAALENNIAALDPKQGTEQFQSELNKIIAYARGLTSRLKEAYNVDVNGAVQTGSKKPTRKAGIPQEAIDTLKKNPSGRMRLFFDQTFGKGAAARVLGN